MNSNILFLVVAHRQFNSEPIWRVSDLLKVRKTQHIPLPALTPFSVLESAVWVEESPVQSLAWGRRAMAPSGYSQEDPLGLSIEGNEKKFPDDLREIFPENSGDLSRENFSPCWFLLENHHATSFDDLRAGYSYLKRKVEGQKEGQLSFLKTHVGAVIDQLDTMMALKSKMDNEGEIDLAKRVNNLQTTISSKL